MKSELGNKRVRRPRGDAPGEAALDSCREAGEDTKDELHLPCNIL